MVWGGTKIEVIALDDGGQAILRKRVATPRDDYSGTVETIAALVEWVEPETGQRGSVGVGIPGTLSPYTGKVKNANSVWFNGQRLDKDLQTRLQRSIRMANDANCMAVSEATDGAGIGMSTVFAVIIGTGCGSGIALNGKVHSGGNGVAGEWRHNPLPWMDEDEERIMQKVHCYCGKSGCTETFIPGTGFMQDYARLSGQQRSGAEIVHPAADGDKWAERALKKYERQLAKALAQVINVLDPDVVVLADGMSNVNRLYDSLPSVNNALGIWQRMPDADSSGGSWRRQRRARRGVALAAGRSALTRERCKRHPRGGRSGLHRAPAGLRAPA